MVDERIIFREGTRLRASRRRGSYLGRVHRPRMTRFSTAQRREDVDEVAAHGVVGA
jgi:hypothetical protein